MVGHYRGRRVILDPRPEEPLVRIGIPREVHPTEKRAAATPGIVVRLGRLGFDVIVERGTGEDMVWNDEAYASAGERATFKNITFDSNTATNRGGAVANLGAATQGVMRFDQCVFTGNIAGGSSGAIWVSALDYTKAVNCLFINNSAGTTGGAVRNEHLFDAINCTFVGNTATAGADTFETTSGDITLLVNSIVTNSTATSHSGPGFFVLRNSILPEGPSGTPDANGNFNADPMFINQGTGDYRLSSNSPAIDAGRSLGTFGTIDITSISTDLDGLVRNLDDTDTPNTGIPAWELNIDIGAYEFQPTTIADCPADQNFNGTLEAADFTAWISNFNNGCD